MSGLTLRIAVLFAGLFGAAGTGGAAYAAHGGGDASLAAIAAAIAFVHAPTLLALGLGGERLRGAAWPIFGMILGTVLFSGDLAMRLATGDRLFFNAAPAGGSILILSWLLVGVLSLCAVRSSN